VPLAPGTKLGPYEIVAPLGAGGMGEVYRAKDSRLGREVAIKVLPQHLSASAEIRTRFEREARTVSSLNHPHICVLHDVGREADTDFLVMELVEGETLAQRLARGPLPTAEVLKLGAQIADALDRAHRAGVIHRDLKPGNVMLTRAGAKLMDFGLARATGLAGAPTSGVSVAALTQSPTIAQPLTAEGTIVGTFQYMAPEQLEGKEADARSDLWSLGCVLYEMATGRRAFEGRSQASLITAIMGQDPPPISQVAPMAPAALDRLVRTCLTKDPDERVQTAHDVRLQLQGMSDGVSQAGAPAPAAAQRANAGSRLPWVIASVLAVTTVVLGMMLMRGGRKPPLPVRFSIEAPVGATLSQDGMDLAVAPDGRSVIFVAADSAGTQRLWLRPIDALDAHPLAGTDNATLPFWAPDGRWVGYFADGKLKKVPSAGGNVEVLADANNGRGGTWNRDGVIVYAPAGAGPLFKVGRQEGLPVAVTAVDSAHGQSGHRYPCFLPDGKHFLYAALPPRNGRFEVFVGSLAGGSPKSIGSFDACPVYADPGYLVYLRGRTLVAQRFDAAGLRVMGEPLPLGETPGLSQYTGSPVVSASGAGVVVTLNGTLPNTDLVPFDRTGRRSAPLPAPAGRYASMDFSPDGQRLVLEKDDDRTTQDLWIYELERRTLSRFTFGPGLKTAPTWSPDGARIAYSCDREGPWNVYVKNVGGAGEDTPVFASPALFKNPVRWSADSRTLVVETLEQKTGWDLWTVQVGAKKPVPYLNTPFNERWGAISSDGRWLAYTSDETGKNEIYVQSYPTPGEKHQVSTTGGAYGIWRRDGREILYFSPDFASLLAVDVQSDPGFRAGTPHVLFKVPPGVLGGTGFTPAFDRFILPIAEAAKSTGSLNVLLHWDAMLGVKPNP
jgi:Tol biopolymer transport system component